MGPLNGFRLIELAGIGPAPFCGMFSRGDIDRFRAKGVILAA
jgi:hypothetical protein